MPLQTQAFLHIFCARSLMNLLLVKESLELIYSELVLLLYQDSFQMALLVLNS